MEEQLSNQEINMYLRENLKKHEQTREAFRQIGMKVSIKSIEEIRKWVFEVLTLSSAILGVFIAIGSNSPMIKHKDILSYAFISFILAIIYGFYKLKRGMEGDIDNVPKIINKYCESQTNIIRAEEEFYLKRTKDAFEKMQQTNKKELERMESFGTTKEKRNYDFDIIFYLFFLGLVFIGWSIRYLFGGIMTILFLGFFLHFGWEEYEYYIKKGQNC